MATTFDGDARIITLDVIDEQVSDIYSDWKDWIKAGNAEFITAFRTIGGDPTATGETAAPYFFLLNGWRIRPMEADHILTITGNLFSDPNTEPIFAATLGVFQVFTQLNRSDQSQRSAQAVRDSMALPLSAGLAKQTDSLDKQVERVDRNTQPAS